MPKQRVLRACAGVVALAVVAIGVGLVLVESDPAQRAAAGEHPHGVQPHAMGPPRTIVMVVFDELPLTSLLGPDGRIDASRYPAFAGLARDGDLVPRGHRRARQHRARRAGDARRPLSAAGLRSDVYSHPANLFTLLAHDYELHVSEEATGLCPTSLCVPTPGTTASHLSHGKVERFRRFVGALRETPRPALWFKHVLLPHVPWQYYPSGTATGASRPSRSPGSTA